MFSSRGTVRYEERGQGYRDVEKVGKHWSTAMPQLRATFAAVWLLCRRLITRYI